MPEPAGTLGLIRLGTHGIANPAPGDVPFLSAASGCAWSGRRLYAVGDDQAAVAEFELDPVAVLEALRAREDRDLLAPGLAKRIIPEVLPLDPRERAAKKADFEALTLVTPEHLRGLEAGERRDELLRRFPHGLIFMAGSGGMSWEGFRRSACVVYSLSEEGHIVGLPAKVSLEGLHEHLEQAPFLSGELNIEGVAAYDRRLVLAQRGNSVDAEGRPAKNLLITLALDEVLESFFTDLRVGACELEHVEEYDLGHLELEAGGERHAVKLDFTDLDAVSDDPERRLVFTAAAEGTDAQGAAAGTIAGSVVGVIDADGRIARTWALEDTSIKLEGVDARYQPATGTIDLLLCSDADDPDVPAPLMAARLEP
jgi:hypothetical protein